MLYYRNTDGMKGGMKMDDARELVQEWIDCFEDNHYEFDLFGHQIKVDLPREKVESILEISLLLAKRIKEAQGDLKSEEYKELEERVRKEHPSNNDWVTFSVLEAVCNERLYGRYRDIEKMIDKLNPRDIPIDSASYMLMVRPDIQSLIYSMIRNVDDVDEKYESIVFSFFLALMAQGWGEGLGWYRCDAGNWCWHKEN